MKRIYFSALALVALSALLLWPALPSKASDANTPTTVIALRLVVDQGADGHALDASAPEALSAVQLSQLAQSAEISLNYLGPRPYRLHHVSVSTSGAANRAVIERLRSNPSVGRAFIVPQLKRQVPSGINTSLWDGSAQFWHRYQLWSAGLWHLKAPTSTSFGANFEEAWAQGFTGKGINVGVVDEGLMGAKVCKTSGGSTTVLPELQSALYALTDGYDGVRLSECRSSSGCKYAYGNVQRATCSSGSTATAGSDSGSHGAHVMGLIAASATNGSTSEGAPFATAAVGGAHGSRVVFAAVDDTSSSQGSLFGSDGTGWMLGAVTGSAPANSVKLINASWGDFTDNSSDCSSWLDGARILDRARGKTFIVTAAGNSSSLSRYQFPANCPNVITVAASQSDGSMPSFSNYGPEVDIAAPGYQVLSSDERYYLDSSTTRSTPYTIGTWPSNGTSMAAPLVTATVALMLEANPNLSLGQVKAILSASATAFSTSSRCSSTSYGNCGAGIVNAGEAVKLAKAAKDLFHISTCPADNCGTSLDADFNLKEQDDSQALLSTQSGNSVEKTFYLKNLSSSALATPAFSLSTKGGNTQGLSLSTNTCTSALAGNNTCSFGLRFAPTASGHGYGELRLNGQPILLIKTRSGDSVIAPQDNSNALNSDSSLTDNSSSSSGGGGCSTSTKGGHGGGNTPDPLLPALALWAWLRTRRRTRQVVFQ